MSNSVGLNPAPGRKRFGQGFLTKHLSRILQGNGDEQRNPVGIIKDELNKRGLSSWDDLNNQEQVAIMRVVARPGLVLLPTDPLCERWDIAMLLVLIYTCLVTPFEVAFLSFGFNALFVLNRMVDISFLLDMGVQCFTAYRREPEGGDTRSYWVRNTAMIRWRYLKTWFLFDAICIGSSVFDILSLVYSNGDLRRFQVMRVLRVARLLKLVGVLKSSRILGKLMVKLEISYSLVEIGRWTIRLMVAAHLIACIWGLVGLLSEDFGDRTWLLALESYKGISYNREEPFPIYVLCIYWSLMTITSIGYGDIQAQNNAEYIVCCVLMVFGGILWTRIIGSACAAVGMLDAERMQHEQRMDSVLMMCKDRNLPQDLRHRLRGYFNQSRRMLRLANYGEMTKFMSPALRGEVALHVTQGYLCKLSFLVGIEDAFVTSLAKALILHMFPPNEWIIPEAMDLALESMGGHRAMALMDMVHDEDTLTPPLSILEQGLATRRKMLCAGTCWHEDMILSASWLRDPMLALSLAFCSVYHVTRPAFLKLLRKGDYPMAQKAVKKAAVRLGIRRLLALASSAVVGRSPRKMITMRRTESMEPAVTRVIHASLIDAVNNIVTGDGRQPSQTESLKDPEPADVLKREPRLKAPPPPSLETEGTDSLSMVLSMRLNDDRQRFAGRRSTRVGGVGGAMLDSRLSRVEEQLEACRKEQEVQRQLLLQILAATSGKGGGGAAVSRPVEPRVRVGIRPVHPVRTFASDDHPPDSCEEFPDVAPRGRLRDTPFLAAETDSNPGK